MTAEGKEVKARKWELNGTGGKMGPKPSQLQGNNNVGSALVRSAREGKGRGWLGRDSSLFHPSHSPGTLCFGEGQLLEPHLAAAFYSTLPTVNCLKTPAISKKGKYKKTLCQPHLSYRHSHPPLHLGGLEERPEGDQGGSAGLVLIAFVDAVWCGGDPAPSS